MDMEGHTRNGGLSTPAADAEYSKEDKMMCATRWGVAVAFGILVALPLGARTLQDPVEQHDQGHAGAAAFVDFGHPHILTTIANEVILPEPDSDPDGDQEVTVPKRGTVTFRMNGAGHGIAVYPVSKNTTREHISEDLCQGGPSLCNGTTGTARVYREITDGEGRVVVVVAAGGPAEPIDHKPGEELSAGTGAFLLGKRLSMDGTLLPGTNIRVRFNDHGRYLVLCINRAHAVNQWMFAFVNVIG
jgi:hypothetical protein